MKAKDLIKQVNECKAENWRNSDLSRGNELSLEIIAAHYEKCSECREDFDTLNIQEEFLVQLDQIYPYIRVEEWTCEKETN